MDKLSNIENPILVDPTRFEAQVPRIEVDKKSFLIEQVIKTYSSDQHRCESCPLSRLHIELVEDRDNDILGTTSIMCSGRQDPSNPNKKIVAKTNGFKLMGDPINEGMVEELFDINERNFDINNACGFDRRIINDSINEEYNTVPVKSWKDVLTQAASAFFTLYATTAQNK